LDLQPAAEDEKSEWWTFLPRKTLLAARRFPRQYRHAHVRAARIFKIMIGRIISQRRFIFAIPKATLSLNDCGGWKTLTELMPTKLTVIVLHVELRAPRQKSFAFWEFT
jgi:hypothetical protein